MVELRGTLLSNSTSFIYVILLIGNLLIPMILLLILMLLFTFQKLLWKSKNKGTSHDYSERSKPGHHEPLCANPDIVDLVKRYLSCP